ncbi:DUF397 domain-containing protein [Micromonospora sp. NPDC049523]|uniref:DUF397 domain-containing protein n=1 Tax=Micromonospora sp. NPDC049523 TaxID=3155921 RepID=UPI00342AE5AF
MTGTQLSGAVWRRSSRSGSNANCVEVADLGALDSASAGPTTVVGVRDSKDLDGPVLAFAATAWASFVAAARRNRLG